MTNLLLVAAPLVFAAVVLGGCWAASLATHCAVCGEGLPWLQRRLGICPGCWATWQAAVAGSYQGAWEAAIRSAAQAGLWGPALRQHMTRELAGERSQCEHARHRAA